LLLLRAVRVSDGNAGAGGRIAFVSGNAGHVLGLDRVPLLRYT
jgi:hypothetical protein